MIFEALGETVDKSNRTARTAAFKLIPRCTKFRTTFYPFKHTFEVKYKIFDFIFPYWCIFNKISLHRN